MKILLFFCGSSLCSFVYCFLYRRLFTVTNKRSICENCGHILSFKDLIPVVGYLINHGKCSYCGYKISSFYPISELFSGIIFAFIFIKYGFSINTIKYLLVYFVLLIICFIDYKTMIIPDSLVVALFINSVIFNGLSVKLVYGLLIGLFLLILASIMKKAENKECIGGGDIKLISVLSTYLSIEKSLISLIIACVLGVLFIIVTKKQNECFAFGPFICLGYILLII